MSVSDTGGGKKRKKLEKKVAKGQLNTFEGYKECMQLNIAGVAQVQVMSDPGRAQASFDIHSSELRDLLACLLYDKGTIPRTFSLKNRHFARQIMILHFTEWGTTNGEPMHLSTLTEGRSMCSTHSMRISRDPLHAVPLASKLLCMRDSSLNKFLGKNEESVATDVTGTKRDRKGEPVAAASNSTSSEQSDLPLAISMEKARFTMPAALLRMWSYPLPVSVLNSEREGHMRLRVPPELLGREDPADRCYVTPPGDTSSGSGGGSNGVEGLVPSEKEARQFAYLAERPCSWAAMVTEERQGQGQGQGQGAATTAAVPRFNIDVLVRNSIVKAHYACTVPKDSRAYHSLFEASSSTSSSSCTRHSVRVGKGKGKEEEMEEEETELPLSVCALDCEMCQTESGPALTRLTVVAESQTVVLDVLVQPPEEITDYVTQYSGVSAELLKVVSREGGVAVNRAGTMVLSMRQAQVAFLRLVSKETMLVGHSLDSDLAALKIVHERVVDTAYLYPHPRGFPLRNKLRNLAKEHLGLNIQTAGVDGHDSSEDAKAALLLTLHLLNQNRSIIPGVNSNSGTRGNNDKQEYYNYEHAGRKATLDPSISLLPRGQGAYPVQSSLCYDQSSWMTSIENGTLGGSSSSGNGDAYGNYSISPCLGPDTELFTGSSTEQTLARTVGWLRRRDNDKSMPPPLRFCYASLKFGGIESAVKALQSIESTLSGEGEGEGEKKRKRRCDYLIVLIAQQALTPLYALRHRKRVVLTSGGKCAVHWSEGMEEHLKQAGAVANFAQVTFINGSASTSS